MAVTAGWAHGMFGSSLLINERWQREHVLIQLCRIMSQSSVRQGDHFFVPVALFLPGSARLVTCSL
jgi:hypothetical protein